MAPMEPPTYPNPIINPCHQALRFNCLSSAARNNTHIPDNTSIIVLNIQIMCNVSTMLARTSPVLMAINISAVPSVACGTADASSNKPDNLAHAEMVVSLAMF